MKKILATFVALLLGVVGLTVNAIPAEAHQGNIKVSATDCVDYNTMKATYTVGWTNGTSSGKLYTKLGLYSGGTSTSGWTFEKNVSGEQGSTTFTMNHSFSGSNGPWVAFKIIFSDNYVVGGDTRVEGWNWGKCKPPQPEPKIITDHKQSCDLAITGTKTLGGEADRTGKQEYVWYGSAWVLEDESKISWGDWKYTAWDDETWFKNCAPGKPKDIVVPYSDKKQDCTGVYETSWNMTQTYSWDAKNRKWILGDPVKTDFVDWHKTGDVSNEYYDAKCKPNQPAPEPRVKSEESCTLNDVGGVNNYTGTEAYVWNSDARKWELSGIIVWNDPVFTAYDNDTYFTKCAPDKPNPKVSEKPFSTESCTLKDVGGVETWTEVTTIEPVWNPDTRTWVDGTPVVTEKDRVFTAYTDKEYFSKCAPTQPNPEPRTKTEEGCAAGGYTHYTGTEAYQWDEKTRTWVLSGNIVWDEETTFVPYTDEEYLAKGCTEYPGDKTVPKSDSKTNCDGKWTRNWDVVTTYKLENHEWVANDPKIQNDTGWVLDRKLTKAEKADKGCVIPDEVLAYTGVSDEGIMVYGAAGLGAILVGLMTVGFLRRRRTN